jgi:hypothetical protein
LINLVKDTDTFDEYDWLVFIDDDAILNTKMWNYVMPYLNKEFVYGLKMPGVYEKAPNTTYPSGGSGYFISPSLIKNQNHMINNEWGIEDAAVGRWLEQNNIILEDHFNIGEKRYYLKLNGWFPFGEEYKLLSSDELQEPIYSKRILECIKDPQKRYIELSSCMTHHYIRSSTLMKYLYEIFQRWSSEDMEQNLSR